MSENELYEYIMEVDAKILKMAEEAVPVIRKGGEYESRIKN